MNRFNEDPPTLRERSLELGRAALQKRRLYLDTRVWNDFCDLELGQIGTPEVRSLYDRIQSLVSEGDLVCPLHLHVLTELKKQQIAKKRQCTARVMDRLSHGLTLIAPPERVELEVLRFVQAVVRKDLEAQPPLGEVWTKAAFILGSPQFQNPGLTKRDHVWVCRLTEGELWEMPVAAIERALRPSAEEMLVSQRSVVEMLNEKKRWNRSRFGSFKQLYENELIGLLDVFDGEIEQVAMTLLRLGGVDPDSASAEQSKAFSNIVRNTVILSAQERGIEHGVPTAHVMTTLYARMDWDALRQYNRNDSADFWHAASALPYCNAFMTERSLCGLIGQAKLPEVYNCQVFHTYTALADWLEVPLTKQPDT